MKERAKIGKGIFHIKYKSQTKLTIKQRKKKASTQCESLLIKTKFWGSFLEKKKLASKMLYVLNINLGFPK